MTNPKEYRVVCLKECPTPESLQLCDTPQKAFEYWNLHLKTHPYVDSEVETMVVVVLNTRRRVKGHHLVSTGTMDTLLISPLAVFRVAVTAGASALILMHSHPSGDPSPSEADIKVTRDLIRAGQLLKIEVLDHVIVGAGRYCSLREAGYFF
jgi:DNA repair protein RadC